MILLQALNLDKDQWSPEDKWVSEMMFIKMIIEHHASELWICVSFIKH